LHREWCSANVDGKKKKGKMKQKEGLAEKVVFIVRPEFKIQRDKHTNRQTLCLRRFKRDRLWGRFIFIVHKRREIIYIKEEVEKGT
jgi:hypothetical protein